MIGPPWPQQVMRAPMAANFAKERRVRARSTLNTPGITWPSTGDVATVSPVNSTPWVGRWSAMLPGVWPGT
jgi:hypothetical protein